MLHCGFNPFQLLSTLQAPSPNIKISGTQVVVAAMAYRTVVEVLVERDSTFATTAEMRPSSNGLGAPGMGFCVCKNRRCMVGPPSNTGGLSLVPTAW
jgi:hypothetical protein